MTARRMAAELGACLLGLAILVQGGAAGAIEGRREIVVVVDDDVTAFSMSAYGEPGAANTPNFDSLASEGQLYLNVAASSMCTPSRRGIFFGESELQHGIGSSVSVRQGMTLPNIARPNLITGLQSSGYRVVIVGKLHVAEVKFGVDESSADLTSAHAMGWDEARALLLGNPIALLPLTVGSPHPSKNHHYHWIQTDWETGLGTIQNGYTTDVITDEALAVLRDDDPRPLALFVMYSAPHRPMNPPPGEVGACAPTTEAQDSACYDPAIEYIDSRLGDIMAELDWEEDLLIKTADNGRPAAAPLFGFCGPLNSKAYATPCGTRVPMAIRGRMVWPGTVTSPINLVDLHDTLLEYVGAPPTGPESVSFRTCFFDPTGCRLRDATSSILFETNGLPLAMYNGLAYDRYQMGFSTVVNGTLYGMIREWDELPTADGPGPYSDRVYDLGPESPSDPGKRYGQVEVEALGFARVAQLQMQQEAARLELGRLQSWGAAVPAASPGVRFGAVAAMALLGFALQIGRRPSR